MKKLRSILAAEGLLRSREASGRYDFGTPEGDLEIDASEFRGVLKALAGAATYQIRPNDIRELTYQPTRRGGKIVGITIEDHTRELGNFQGYIDERRAQQWGGVSLEEVIQVLDDNGARRRARRPPRRRRPMYFSPYD